MSTADLRSTERDWNQLRRQFASSFRPAGAETGTIGLVSRCSANGEDELLLARMLWPQKGDLKVATNRSLVFDPSYIRRAHLEMRKERLAGLAVFHTHPLSDSTVGFSPYDNAQEPQLFANLLEIEPKTILVSVVAGKNSLCGRLWSGARTVIPLRKLTVIGDSWTEHPLDGRPSPLPPPPAALFDRGLPLTGAGALARLSRMKVAVVGVSGTGSITCELLARAGCRSIMAIDDDVAKDVNLGRVLYMTDADVAAKTPKVEILRRGIEGLGLRCSVEALKGNVLDDRVLRRLREADLIFGCVDAAYPRLLMGKFAFQYLRPYIDVGSEIGGDDAGIAALMARTSYVAPGRYCLQCSGVITSRQLHLESLTWEERKRVIAQGYSDDLIIDKPAVMDLNMRSASFGMMVLRHLLQPFLVTPLPVTISENLVTYTMLAIKSARVANPKCPTCRLNKHLGYGDCGPTIGLDEATLAVIADRRDGE